MFEVLAQPQWARFEWSYSYAPQQVSSQLYYFFATNPRHCEKTHAGLEIYDTSLEFSSPFLARVQVVDSSLNLYSWRVMVLYKAFVGRIDYRRIFKDWWYGDAECVGSGVPVSNPNWWYPAPIGYFSKKIPYVSNNSVGYPFNLYLSQSGFSYALIDRVYGVSSAQSVSAVCQATAAKALSEGAVSLDGNTLIDGAGNEVKIISILGNPIQPENTGRFLDVITQMRARPQKIIDVVRIEGWRKKAQTLPEEKRIAVETECDLYLQLA